MDSWAVPFRDWSCGRWVVSGLVVSEGSLGRVWWMVTVSVDGLAGQHDTDTSEMIIRWIRTPDIAQ